MRMNLCPKKQFLMILVLSICFGIDGPLRADEASSPTVDSMIDALTPRTRRGASSTNEEGASTAVSAVKNFVEIRTKRGPSMRERAALYESLRTMPQLDLVIYFDFDSSEISPHAEPTLAKLGAALSNPKFANKSFVIAGHTDRKGRSNYNLHLSERRASAVRAYLVKNFDLRADHVEVVGYGFEQLADPNDPYSGKNRRVQIVNVGG